MAVNRLLRTGTGSANRVGPRITFLNSVIAGLTKQRSTESGRFKERLAVLQKRREQIPRRLDVLDVAGLDRGMDVAGGYAQRVGDDPAENGSEKTECDVTSLRNRFTATTRSPAFSNSVGGLNGLFILSR